MQIPNKLCTAPVEVDRRAGATTKPTSTRERRGRARLYIAIAERHLAKGDDAGLVAALVRAAWREHRQADANAREPQPPRLKAAWTPAAALPDASGRTRKQ